MGQSRTIAGMQAIAASSGFDHVGALALLSLARLAGVETPQIRSTEPNVARGKLDDSEIVQLLHETIPDPAQ